MAKPTPILNVSDSVVEELVPGLTFQWLFDKRAIALSAEHTSRELVDAWADKIIEINKLWPDDRCLYILNDFSGKDCVSTPYNQQKNRELMKMFPHRKSVTALVVKQNLTMQLSRLFIRAIPGNKKIYLSFNRDEALAWLKKQIDNEA
jgi:hypothetical protein